MRGRGGIFSKFFSIFTPGGTVFHFLLPDDLPDDVNRNNFLLGHLMVALTHGQKIVVIQPLIEVFFQAFSVMYAEVFPVVALPGIIQVSDTNLTQVQVAPLDFLPLFLPSVGVPELSHSSVLFSSGRFFGADVRFIVYFSAVFAAF